MKDSWIWLSYRGLRVAGVIKIIWTLIVAGKRYSGIIENPVMWKSKITKNKSKLVRTKAFLPVLEFFEQRRLLTTILPFRDGTSSVNLGRYDLYAFEGTVNTGGPTNGAFPFDRRTFFAFAGPGKLSIALDPSTDPRISASTALEGQRYLSTGGDNTPITIDVRRSPSFYNINVIWSVDVQNPRNIPFRILVNYQANPGSGGSTALPNINVGNTRLSHNNTYLTVDYSITGNNLPFPSTIAFYWATGPTFAERLETTPLASVSTATSARTNPYTVSVPITALGQRPTFAPYILAVADSTDLVAFNNPGGQIIESNENDNFASVLAPARSTVAILSFGKNRSDNQLFSNGNYDGAYQITGSVLPNNPNLTLGVYWATGPTSADVIGSPVYTSPLSRTLGIHHFSVKISNLILPPINAKYLVAVLDNQHVLPPAERTNNVATIGSDVLQARLSVELDLIAPPLNVAITREAQMFLWLAKYAQTINKTAKDYNVDPRAIAGAIAWEALQNTLSLKNKIAFSLGYSPLGPGKVVPWEVDASAVEGTYAFGHFLPAQFGKTPIVSAGLRSLHLQTPENAITYIAAILNAYAVEASVVGYNLRTQDNIGVLLTFYNGLKLKSGSYVTLLSGPKFFAQRAKDPSPLMHNPEMGQWVDNNLDFLGAALGMS